MKTKELKKLSSEFSEFLSESGSTNIEGVMSEFWSAKFGVNNKEREAELLEYWNTPQKGNLSLNDHVEHSLKLAEKAINKALGK